MTWTETGDAFLATHRSSTAIQHGRALDDFADWYRGSDGESSEPTLPTGEEIREWRACLTGVKK